MIRACILIEALPGKIEAVLANVKKVEGVRKAFIVFGRYDIVAFAEAPDYEAIRNIALKIDAMKDVEETETIVEA